MELETRLVTQVRLGDRDALAEFVRQHETLIRSRFRERFESLPHKMFDSSDFLATVLRRFDAVLVSRGGSEVTGFESLHTMLGRIMLAAASDYSRSQSAEAPLPVRSNDRPRAERMTPIPHDQPEHVWDLVPAGVPQATLDATDNQIARLRAQGYEHRAVADALGMTVAAVRMRWHRICSRVRQVVRTEEAR